MKRIFYIIFLLVPLITYAEPVKLTIDEAIDRAMEANYDIKMAEERLVEVKAMVGEAASGALPQIIGAAGYERDIKRPQLFFNGNAVTIGSKNTYSASATVTQPIYEAGKVFHAIKAAGSEKRKSLADIENAKDEIKLAVIKTYYQTLLADKLVETTKKTLKQLESHLSAIKVRYNEGLESDYTLMRQEVEAANMEPELLAAEKARLIFINALKVLLVLPEDAEVELAGRLDVADKTVPPEGDLIATALKNRSDLVAASSRKSSLKQKVGAEKGGYLPTLSLTSQISWQAQTDDFKIGGNEDYYALNAGALLSWPIFDGFKTHFKIKEAKAQLKIAGEEELKLKAGIASDVKNAAAAYKEAIQRVYSQKKSLILAQKAVDIAGLRFKEGLTGQLELNDTILTRDRTERLYYQALYDAIAGYAELERSVGGEL